MDLSQRVLQINEIFFFKICSQIIGRKTKIIQTNSEL